MSKGKPPRKWTDKSDPWSDDKLIDQLSDAYRNPPPPGRNDHGRKPKDSCMITLIMLGSGAAGIAALASQAVRHLL